MGIGRWGRRRRSGDDGRLFVYAYRSGAHRRARSSGAAVRRRVWVSRRTRCPITPRSRGFGCVTRRRSRAVRRVLELCARAGLVDVGVVAVDGTKIAAARRITHAHYSRSPRRSSRTLRAWMRPRMSCFGEARGEELPEGCAPVASRRKLLREAKQALDAERLRRPRRSAQSQRAPSPNARRASSQTGSLSCALSPSTRSGLRPGSPATGRDGCRCHLQHQALPADQIRPRARSTSAIATRAISRRRAGGCRATTPRPSSRRADRARGRDQTESLDTANLQPMIETADAELQAAGVSRPLDVVANAGYWKNERDRSARSARRRSAPSSRPTPTDARSLGPAVAAAAMT